jgi:hypothetical protein
MLNMLQRKRIQCRILIYFSKLNQEQLHMVFICLFLFQDTAKPHLSDLLFPYYIWRLGYAQLILFLIWLMIYAKAARLPTALLVQILIFAKHATQGILIILMEMQPNNVHFVLFKTALLVKILTNALFVIK